MKRKICLLSAVTVLSASSLLAQAPTPAPMKPAADAAPGAQRPMSPMMPPRPSNEMKPYAEVITAKAKTRSGLFKVHKVEDRYYFEISDSLLKRDILVVNR